MNRIILTGRLTANPEFEIKESGTQICYFRIAVNNRRNDTTLFINVKTFSKLAELCQKYLQKATLISLEGRLDNYKTEDREYWCVIADEVEFLKGTKENEQKTQQN